MTRDEQIALISKAIKKRTAEVKKSHAVATEVLRALGVLTRSGRVKRKYRPQQKYLTSEI